MRPFLINILLASWPPFLSSKDESRKFMKDIRNLYDIRKNVVQTIGYVQSGSYDLLSDQLWFLHRL